MSAISIANLWREKLRLGLHNCALWMPENGNKLIYAPSGAGFNGIEEMSTFCLKNSEHVFSASATFQTVDCFVDEVNGKVFDEFILNWTQKTPRMEWMLPGHDLPLQNYRLNFAISAEIDVSTRLLKSVRVYWDQASLLLQSGLLMRSVRSLLRPGSSEALENALNNLPICNDYRRILGEKVSDSSDKPKIGALNNFSSILSDLPASTAGPAVSTPQRPTRSRSLNPALLSTLKFDCEQAFDSPAPENVRVVKSRNIFFDEETEKEVSKPQNTTIGLFDRVNSLDTKYNPSLNLNEAYVHQYESKIFSNGSPTKKSNLPQTDRILFESHVFDRDNNPVSNVKHVATAPPQCPSTILSPEEALKHQPESVSSTLSRPGMMGHLRGASLSTETAEATEKFIPSTAIRFDPNRSQIVLGDENDLPSVKNYQQSSTRKPAYDPNRSQIVLGDL